MSGGGAGRGKRRPGRGTGGGKARGAEGGAARGGAGGGRSEGAGGRSSGRGARDERPGNGASNRARSERPGRGATRPSGRGSRAGHSDGGGDRPAEAVLYGRNPVAEALRAGRRRVHRIWATAAAAREPWLAGARVPIGIVDNDEVERRAGSDAHQGVCAQVDRYPYADAAELLRGDAPLIVALDEVQDPQNLGAICRTAECVGAAGVVICERRAAQVTAAAAKASAGAVEHLRIARVRNLADFLLEAREAGAWCYGAASVDGAVAYTEPDWAGAVVLVLGAEGRGLRPRVAAACDALVALPMRGRIGSLNASAAAAAILYAILQRRDSP